MVYEFCLKMSDFHVTFRDLLHAVNLRHGTDGFTSSQKEGVLKIFSPWKIQRLRSGLNPQIWGTKGQHATSRPPKPRISSGETPVVTTVTAPTVLPTGHLAPNAKIHVTRQRYGKAEKRRAPKRILSPTDKNSFDLDSTGRIPYNSDQPRGGCGETGRGIFKLFPSDGLKGSTRNLEDSLLPIGRRTGGTSQMQDN